VPVAGPECRRRESGSLYRRRRYAADCLGTCHRQQAKSVLQLDTNPAAGKTTNPDTPWPLWPKSYAFAGSTKREASATGKINDAPLSATSGARFGIASRALKHYFDEAGNGSLRRCPGRVALALRVVLLPSIAGPESAVLTAFGLKTAATDANYMNGSPGSSPPATVAAASLWSSGPSRRARAARHVDEFFDGPTSVLPARDR